MLETIICNMIFTGKIYPLPAQHKSDQTPGGVKPMSNVPNKILGLPRNVPLKPVLLTERERSFIKIILEVRIAEIGESLDPTLKPLYDSVIAKMR